MKNIFIYLLFPMSAFAQNVTVETQPNTTTHIAIKTSEINTPCAMAAADVRLFADDFQNGVSKTDEIKRYGNSGSRRSMIRQVYQMSKNPQVTPSALQEAAYEQCSASIHN